MQRHHLKQKKTFWISRSSAFRKPWNLFEENHSFFKTDVFHQGCVSVVIDILWAESRASVKSVKVKGGGGGAEESSGLASCLLS